MPPSRLTRRAFLHAAGAAAAATPALARAADRGGASARRPNILFALADDWSHPHAGVLGDPVVRTPTFDRLAREGVLFPHAYCAAPSCSPSRAAILTGQMHYRLEEGANLWSTLDAKFPVYPDLLAGAGYHVGAMKKGWGPGNVRAGGRTQNPAGKGYKDFDAFLDVRPEGAPFCFWFGSHDPHRGYDRGSGEASGMRPEDVVVPPYLADAPEVRGDILDYFFEVQRFDRDLGAMLARLEAMGELDRTLVVMTSDNGWPFPRAKTTLYDSGTRMPLAVRWGAEVKGGRTVTDFVSFTDFAPTFLGAAGVAAPGGVTGRSLLSVLTSGKDGRVDPARDRVVTGRERHHGQARPGCLGYPGRALRTDEWLYIRNFEPDRWPAGDPPADADRFDGHETVGGYADIDGGPTKAYMFAHRGDPEVRPAYDLATAKRPADELYDLRADPHQLTNLAAWPEHAEALARMRRDLMRYLEVTADPRLGDAPPFDAYPHRR